MRAKTGILRLLGLALWGLFGLFAPALAGQIVLGNITIYPPEEARQFIRWEGGAGWFEFPGAQRWQILADGVNYRPMPAEEVLAALRAISFPLDGVNVTVVILPAPRADLPVSYAEGTLIFLSPGRLDYAPEHIHVTVAHEMGHVVHHVLMPRSRNDLWKEYADLRGASYEAAVYAEKHSERLSEMFAEDFRVLFGGAIASSSSQLENHELIDPGEVRGLEDFFLSLPDRWNDILCVRAFPNPFSGTVSIEAFGTGAASGIEAGVFDVTGRLVASLRPVAGPGSGSVWDGKDGNGRQVRPGIYYVRVSSGAGRTVLKLIKTSS